MNIAKRCIKHELKFQKSDESIEYCLLKDPICKHQSEKKDVVIKEDGNKNYFKVNKYYRCNLNGESLEIPEFPDNYI